MKKFYVIFPVIGVIIFAFFFWRFNADFEAREHAKTEEVRLARVTKQQADFEAKRKAVEAAIANQEKRKQEKAERETREAAEKQVQLDLNDQADRARTELDRVVRQVDRLKIEISVEDEALKRLNLDKSTLVAEDEFLKQYVKAAEDNQKSLEKLLTKVEAVDKAAALAALQAAKKKS